MGITTLFLDFGGVCTCSPVSAVNDFGVQRDAQSGRFIEIRFGAYRVDGDKPIRAEREVGACLMQS